MSIQYIKRFKIIILLLLTLATSNAHAVRWTGEAGIHLGGDTLANTVDRNGNDFKIKAGDLITLGIGPHFDLTDNTHIRTLIGWKVDSVQALSDSSIDSSSTDNTKFSRFPLDVMYFYQTRNWNFGGGLTYHMNPSLSGDLINKVNYDNALGYALEVAFRLGEFFYLGGKYTIINYKEKNSNAKVDGNSVGVVIGITFGDK